MRIRTFFCERPCLARMPENLDSAFPTAGRDYLAPSLIFQPFQDPEIRVS